MGAVSFAKAELAGKPLFCLTGNRAVTSMQSVQNPFLIYC